MDLETIASLGKIGMGLFGAFSAKEAADNRRNFYEEQAILNRQIGAFNAQVAEMVGSQQAEAISIQTKRAISEQIVAFGNRGISLDGSPMLVLQETINTGTKAAQEAYFNAAVSKQNALYGGYIAASQSRAKAEDAKYQAKQAISNIFEQFVSGISLGKSAFKSALPPAKNYNIAPLKSKDVDMGNGVTRSEARGIGGNVFEDIF
jgi:hypothetical protein